MKPIDRDLRDALEPLAGDPIADARRVLAALPPLAPPPRGLPPAGWWMSGAGLLLGLGAGLLLARASATPAAPPAASQPADQQPADGPKPGEPEPVDKPDEAKPGDEKPADKPDEPKKPDQPTWQMPEKGMVLMAFAPMAVDEPGVGFQELEAGNYIVADNTQLLTRDGQVGLYCYGSMLRLRLDVMTRVRVDNTRVVLDQGRIWVKCASDQQQVRVDGGLAAANVEGGTCMFVREAAGLSVIVVDGEVSMRTPQNEVARLEPRQQAWVDADRGISRIQQVPFLGTATSWMTPMILLEQDDSELRARVKEMVAAFEDGTRRDAAEDEIRKLGSICVPMLVYGIEQGSGHGADYADLASGLCADIVDMLRAHYLLPLLLRDEPGVRVQAFRGLARATGEQLDQSEAYWRQAARPERRSGHEAWAKRLQR